MYFRRMSPKQQQIFSWWRAGRHRDKIAIICDGAVRSGKTSCMAASFVLWAMSCHKTARQFALCGRTIESVRRNVLAELLPYLRTLGYAVEETVSKHRFTVAKGRLRHTFHVFGGKDEASAALIQGITLAGVLLDEVALMPKSFVMQATARCSVEGAKLWFSCNPDSPAHWFYTDWIQKAQERRALYLHFTMEDNPSLSAAVKNRYYNMYSGVFFQRYVLGLWVAAEGRVYDFFDESYVASVPSGGFTRYAMSVDYGTRNPFSAGLWGDVGNTWYRIDEFYYDGRAAGVSKTDGEYLAAVENLLAGRRCDFMVVDPSAASFIALLRQAGYAVRGADNRVLDGIRVTAQALRERRLRICAPCVAAVREFSQYCWDLRAGTDQVRKEYDHAMDEIRYFAMETQPERQLDPFTAMAVERMDA